MITIDEERNLIQAAQAGDEHAFEQLVRRYEHSVANIIYLTFGGVADAEDMTQEVFIKVYRALPKFKQQSSFYSWIYRITINLCIDEMRKRKLRRMVSLRPFFEDEDDEVPSTTVTAFTKLEDAERKRVILKALGQLPPTYRIVLALRDYEDMTYSDIAKILNISNESVKSRIFRARELMRELLKPYFPERI